MDIEKRFLQLTEFSEESMTRMMQDEDKHRRIMLILQQTLREYGYETSAKELEKQSKVDFYSESIQNIQSSLRNENDYYKAIEIIEAYQPQKKQGEKIKKSQLNMIHKLLCQRYISENKLDKALNIIEEKITKEHDRESLCKDLVLGNHSFTTEYFQSQKQKFIDFCIRSQQKIQPSEIEVVINSYKGYSNKELNHLYSSSNTQSYPPMTQIWNSPKIETGGQFTHLKHNSKLDLLVAVAQIKDQVKVYLYRLSRKNLHYQKGLSESRNTAVRDKFPVFQQIRKKSLRFAYGNKKQSLQAIAWNHSTEGKIALSSYSILKIMNCDLEVLATVEAPNKMLRTLYLDFNPLSDLLYTSGYYQCLHTYDSTGEHIVSIYPFAKTRKFLFDRGDSVVSIGLTKATISRHNLLDQNLQNMEILTNNQEETLLDLAQSKSKNIFVVGSFHFIYVLDFVTLKTIGKCLAPPNPNDSTIELAFFQNYLITLARGFTAYSIEKDIKVLEEEIESFSIRKEREWSCEGTFSISNPEGLNPLMVSGHEGLTVWQESGTDFAVKEDSVICESQSRMGHFGSQNLEMWENLPLHRRFDLNDLQIFNMNQRREEQDNSDDYEPQEVLESDDDDEEIEVEQNDNDSDDSGMGEDQFLPEDSDS